MTKLPYEVSDRRDHIKWNFLGIKDLNGDLFATSKNTYKFYSCRFCFLSSCGAIIIALQLILLLVPQPHRWKLHKIIVFNSFTHNPLLLRISTQSTTLKVGHKS